MAEPLDKTKNYRISFNIETDTNRVEKARVTFFAEGNSATLTKIIPEDALTEATEMVFDTRDLASVSTSPLVDLGDVTAIGIAIDSGAAMMDGADKTTKSGMLAKNLEVLELKNVSNNFSCFFAQNVLYY